MPFTYADDQSKSLLVKLEQKNIFPYGQSILTVDCMNGVGRVSVDIFNCCNLGRGKDVIYAISPDTNKIKTPQKPQNCCLETQAKNTICKH